MNLSIGIVGLPNVGKSTLFNALLKKQVAYAANYPFATIEPNVGIVEVPDPRLPEIAKVVHTEKIVPATVEFYDIAGLVAGASKGEGLGNKFLSHIREVAAIAHIVRLFDDGDVIHVANSVDAKRDMEIINTELILADLATLEKQREPRGNASKEDILRYEAVKKLKNHLDTGNPARSCEFTDDELIQVNSLQLLTMKPVIYVFNVSERQLENHEETEKQIEQLLGTTDSNSSDAQTLSETVTSKQFTVSSSQSVQDRSVTRSTIHVSQNNPNTYNLKPNSYLYLNAKLENDVLAFSSEEQKEYLAQYHLTDTGLNRLIRSAYETLGLISFLTGGELEARAWTIERGTSAQMAAGAIHTDFIKKFIKADIVPYDKFVEAGGWVSSREKGLVQTVGKEHIMQDGDVVEFKIGA